MRSILCSLVFASLMAAEEPAFDVKEIAPEQVQKIDTASRELESAMKAFTEAQKRLDAAKAAKDKAVAEASQQFSTFDGECKYPNYAGPVSSTIYIAPTKSFRHVEIRGKFALITQGKEVCGAGSGWITTGTTSTIAPAIGTTTSYTTPTY